MNYELVHVVYIVVSLLLLKVGCLSAENCNRKQVPELTASLPLESSPMVSAVLLECPKQLKGKTISSSERKRTSECEDQLMVNIRVNPSFHIEKMEKFLILDEVYDPHKRAKAKIMSPYLIEISRGEPVMMYPLEFTKSLQCENCENGSNKKEPKNNPPTNPSTGSAACSSPSEENTANKLKTDSMTRIVNKLAEVFSPATKIGSTNENIENPSNSCPNSYKNQPIDANPDDSLQQKNTIPAETYQQKNIEASAKGFENSSKGSPQCLGKMGKLCSHIKHEEQAVVGIDDKLLKQLQSQKMAQLGIIKTNKNRGTYKRGIFSPPEDGEVIDEENVNNFSSSDDIFQMNRNAYNENDDTSDEFISSKNNENKDSDEYITHNDIEKPGVQELHFNIANEIPIQRKPRRKIRFKKRKHRPNVRASLNDNVKQFNDNININSMGNEQTNNNVNDLENCLCDKVYNSQSQNMREDLDLNMDYKEDANSLQSNEYQMNKNNLNVGNDHFATINNNKVVSHNAPDALSKNNKFMKHFSEVTDTKNKNNEGIITKLWIQRHHDNADTNRNTEVQEYSDNDVNDDLDYGEDNNEAEFKNLLLHLKRYYQRMRPSTKNSFKENNLYNNPKETNSFNRNSNFYKDRKLSTNGIFHPQHLSRYHNEAHRWKSEPQTNPESRNHASAASSTLEKNNWIDERNRLPEQGFNFDHSYDSKSYSQENRKYDDNDDKINLNYQKALLDFENSRNEDIQKGLANYFDSHSQFYNTPGYTILPSPLNYGLENSSKSNKQLGWITDPQLDTVDPLDTLDTIYTEKPPHLLANSNKKYYSNVLQPPRSAARELIYREPAQFLPKSLPYENVIDDPYLSISDKLRVLEAVDPPNEKSERKLKQLTQEVDKAYLSRPTPFPFPIPMTGGALAPSSSSANYKFSESGKRKRSFLLYDDLEMRETFDDIENESEVSNPEQNVPIHVADDSSSCSSCGGKGKKPPKPDSSTGIGYSLSMYEDIQPCSSCGGKNKKPPKTDPSIQLPETKCDCKEESVKSCDCNSDETTGTAKELRSISDAWYAVFNMSAPLPFLTTTIRIFRKRHGVWWRIAPSITLNSLSGIFANANLSVLFSSHVDIIQLEKALRLQNHKLIIPKDNAPNLSLPTKKNTTAIYKKTRTLNEYQEDEVLNIDDLSKDPQKILLVKNSDELCNQLEDFHQFKMYDFEQGGKKRGANNYEGVRTIGDLGYFPTSMNLLEQCPNDKQRLCLNMLDDKAPAFTIKVKLPFRENILINRNVSRVKIASIITDATTNDALQVSVQVINEGIESKEFAIVIANCPTGCASAAKTTVKRLLVPRLGQTINFLLPLIVESNQKHKKITCDVLIKTSSKVNNFPESNKKPSKCHDTTVQKRNTTHPNSMGEIKSHIVAIRKMTAETDGRCFCVWECKCHCINNVESHENFNVCHKMSIDERRSAGLLMHCQPGSDEACSLDEGPDENNVIVQTDSNPIRTSYSGRVTSDSSSFFYDLFHNALVLIIIMLLLGLLKAIIGRFCSIKIDKCGFTYVQPSRSYGNSTKLRRFLVNVFFFIVFPFVFWCKCFTPSEEDLLVASTEWQCCGSESKHSDQYKIPQEEPSDSENGMLPSKNPSDSNKTLKKRRCRLLGGEDTDYNNMDEFQMAFEEGIFDDDDDDDDDEEVNTKFILQALVESRESLKKLLRDHSSQHLNPILDDEENVKLKTADELVQVLKSAQIVYRTFDQPIAGIRNIPPGVRYSIQGYFLPSLGREYEFVNYNPLAQYRCMGADGTSMQILRPPVMLAPKLFSRTYANKIDVLEANDLSVHPPANAPCVNISTMAAVASSVVELIASQNARSFNNDSPEESPLALRERILAATHVRDMKQFHLQYQTPLQAEDALLPPETSSSSSPISNVACVYEFDMQDNQLDDESEPLLDDDSHNCKTYQCDTIPE